MSPYSYGTRPGRPPLRSEAWRPLVAALLRSASAVLARRARDVAQPLHARRRRLSVDPILEFHAEAGAPEGALFMDGEYVGRLDVGRL